MSSTNPRGVPLLSVGRDVHGRFRPGNPFARKVAALRKTLLDSVSEHDLKDMLEEEQQQGLAFLQRLWQPPQPSDQGESKPPPR